MVVTLSVRRVGRSSCLSAGVTEGEGIPRPAGQSEEALFILYIIMLYSSCIYTYMLK